MARKPNMTDGGLEAARLAVQDASDTEALRAAQAVLLPLLGYTLAETAEVVGRDRYWVSRARNRVIRGQPALPHGGRRTSLLSEEQEVEIVKQAIIESHVPLKYSKETARAALIRILNERAGGSESTVTAMLNRVAGKLVKGASWAQVSHVFNALSIIYRLEKELSKRAKDDK